MYARAQTWWMIFRLCVAERLAYRGDFVLGTLMRFLPIVTQIFLWTAVFAAVGSRPIAGYTRDNVVAYYLLTMVARAFSSMPGLATSIARQIRDGEIKKFLIQPIDLVSFMLIARLGHKMVYYGVAIGPFALVFYVCRDYFPGWPDPETLAAFIASLLMSFLLGFFLEATFGMIGFWFLEVSSLLFVYMLFNFFFSGHMFPLDFITGPHFEKLPEPLATMAYYQPLQYLAYFPAALFLGKIPADQVLPRLLVQAAWVVFFIVACRMTLAAGYRRYSGYGG
ncbi:MAG: ABC-2 family transporter protein [Pirellulales bacterium]